MIKIRAKNLDKMRDVVENKILKLPNILESELMTILKTEMEEQVMSSNNDAEDSHLEIFDKSKHSLREDKTLSAGFRQGLYNTSASIFPK